MTLSVIKWSVNNLNCQTSDWTIFLIPEVLRCVKPNNFFLGNRNKTWVTLARYDIDTLMKLKKRKSLCTQCVSMPARVSKKIVAMIIRSRKTIIKDGVITVINWCFPYLVSLTLIFYLFQYFVIMCCITVFYVQ